MHDCDETGFSDKVPKNLREEVYTANGGLMIVWSDVNFEAETEGNLSTLADPSEREQK